MLTGRSSLGSFHLIIPVATVMTPLVVSIVNFGSDNSIGSPRQRISSRQVLCMTKNGCFSVRLLRGEVSWEKDRNVGIWYRRMH